MPIIVLIDRDDINIAQTTLKAGPKNLIVKDGSGYGGLIRGMRYVLHRADLETLNPLLVTALEATSNAINITDSVVRLTISEVLQQPSPLDKRFKQVLDILFNIRAFYLQRI